MASRSVRLRMPWSGAVGHVVVNGHGEGIGLLEHHADLLAQPSDVQVLVKDVLPFEADVPLDMHPGDQVVHPVQGLQKGRLAAAGGAQYRYKFALTDREVYIIQYGFVSEVFRYVLYTDDAVRLLHKRY